MRRARPFRRVVVPSEPKLSVSQSPSEVFSLYRKCLREIRLLPHVYLQRFFRIKVGDDIRAISTAKKDIMRHKKFDRVSKELRKMKAANGGSIDAFAHILDLAYGRKGKLKWEIMEPLLSDPNVPAPPPIIRGVPGSRPPVYSGELAALLTSPHSRLTRPLNKASLFSPPNLPKRADPSSEEARLMGPLSKRRQVNIRWRYFTSEWKKVLPPLQVLLREDQPHSRNSHASDTESLARAGIRAVGMQDSGVFEEVERIVSSLGSVNRLIPSQRRSTIDHQDAHSPSVKTRLPKRWLRRRYQQLLGRLPILTYTPMKQGGPGKYTVSLSPSATALYRRFRPSDKGVVDDVELTWLEKADIVERDPSK